MKYKLTNKKIDYLGRTLYQIEAVKKFGNIAKGQKGGFIEKKSNLSQDGNAWVYNYAMVYGNAKVRDNAKVYDCALVHGDAEVHGDADYLVIGPIGSRNDRTTFFKTANNDIKVSCGCFTGTIEEFLEKVNETHGNNNYAKEYKTAVEIAKIHIFGGE